MAVTQTAADDAQTQTASASRVAAYVGHMDGVQSAEVHDMGNMRDAVLVTVGGTLDTRKVRREVGWTTGTIFRDNTLYLTPMD